MYPCTCLFSYLHYIHPHQDVLLSREDNLFLVAHTKYIIITYTIQKIDICQYRYTYI